MTSLKGSILIASPGLLDPNFVRTVVLVAEHNEQGALGLILNRPAATSIGDLWAALGGDPEECAGRAFVGGPVEKNAVFLLHGHLDLAGAQDPVVEGVYLSGEVDTLKQVLAREAGAPAAVAAGGSPPGKLRVYCGYSGWGEGQLDRELEEGGWLTRPATASDVFSSTPEGLWARALGSLGGVYQFFSLMPPDPEMN